MSRWPPLASRVLRGCGLAAGLGGGTGSAPWRGFVGIKSRFPGNPAAGFGPQGSGSHSCDERRRSQLPHPSRTSPPRLGWDTAWASPGRTGTPAPTWAPRGAAGSDGAGQAPTPGLPLPFGAVKPAGWDGRVRMRPTERHRGWGSAASRPGWAHPGRQAPQRLSVTAVPGAIRILFPARQRV